MKHTYREPVNGFTHLFGAIASVVALIAMGEKVVVSGEGTLALIGVAVFGLSLILLYTASSIYHLTITTDKILFFLRRLDHSMIFILIAGTYTPIALIALDGTWRLGLLISIWVLALIGVFFKMFWFNAPRWISTVAYIFMGWIAVLFFYPLSKTIPIEGFFWLILGGVLYTVGAIIYGLKKPNISVNFGFHEIFHVFILLGSLCHFILVFSYLL